MEIVTLVSKIQNKLRCLYNAQVRVQVPGHRTLHQYRIGTIKCIEVLEHHHYYIQGEFTIVFNPQKSKGITVLNMNFPDRRGPITYISPQEIYIYPKHVEIYDFSTNSYCSMEKVIGPLFHSSNTRNYFAIQKWLQIPMFYELIYRNFVTQKIPHILPELINIILLYA